MPNLLNFRDLIIRIFVISITSLVLIFVTRGNNFDFHFKVRKAQETSSEILIIELSENISAERVINQLLKQEITQILVSQYLYDRPGDKVLPFVIGDSQSGFLSLEIKPDDDGLVRRIKFLGDELLSRSNIEPKTSLTLNFRGAKNTFPIINFYDLANEGVSLKGKSIILTQANPINYYTTPLGLLSEAELIANITDNSLENRFIPAKNFVVPFIILIILLFLTTAFLIYLPSTLAMISSVGIVVVYLSISLWVFDNYYLWTPVLPLIIQTILTFLLISNYKFVLNEKTRWNLEKESLYFDEVEEMKTNFLSLFSHDLKTPLAKIIGIVDTLQSKVKDPEILTELEKIHLSSKDLEKYIKRILKMSQVQSKNTSLSKEPADINSLIQKSIDQNMFLANAKDIKIETQLSPLFMIDIDGPLVQEVIINFLENAITYSPKGSCVRIASEEVNDFIKVSIKDEGPGIPKKAQESIWEKHYRFDTKESGYGLGLFLSRYVINLHNGQVFLNSKEKSGSEFGFIIPINEDT